jgi:hypothetical protein
MAETIGTRARQLISRSASLNDSRRNVNRLTQDLGGLNVQGTDISFTSADTIESAGSAFPSFSVGSNIEVIGSALNSRVYKIVTAAAGTLTVEPALIQNESAGALIDIRTV